MSQETASPQTDLRKNITSVFAHHGQPDPEAWLKQLTELDVQEIEKAILAGDLPYQRFVINRYFRNALGMATVDKGIDTMNARWCLIDNDTTDNWVHHFKDSTSKCIIKNSLCGMVAPEVSVATQ